MSERSSMSGAVLFVFVFVVIGYCLLAGLLLVFEWGLGAVWINVGTCKREWSRVGWIDTGANTSIIKHHTHGRRTEGHDPLRLAGAVVIGVVAHGLLGAGGENLRRISFVRFVGACVYVENNMVAGVAMFWGAMGARAVGRADKSPHAHTHRSIHVTIHTHTFYLYNIPMTKKNGP